MDSQTLCNHQIVYFGIININVNRKTIGSIDVWRCSSCKTKFCEEKQLGIESISDTVGMPTIKKNEKWAILICKLKNKFKWKLVKLQNSFILKHECIDGNILSSQVENYDTVDQNHRIIMVDNSVNEAVEI